MEGIREISEKKSPIIFFACDKEIKISKRLVCYPCYPAALKTYLKKSAMTDLQATASLWKFEVEMFEDIGTAKHKKSSVGKNPSRIQEHAK